MKIDLLFFTLLLISTTLTHTSDNYNPRAGNGSFRMPPNKNFGKQRHNAPQESSKSANADQNK